MTPVLTKNCRVGPGAVLSEIVALVSLSTVPAVPAGFSHIAPM